MKRRYLSDIKNEFLLLIVLYFVISMDHKWICETASINKLLELLTKKSLLNLHYKHNIRIFDTNHT